MMEYPTCVQVNLLGVFLGSFCFYGLSAKIEQKEYSWIAWLWAMTRLYYFFDMLITGGSWITWNSAVSTWIGTLTGAYMLFLSDHTIITFRRSPELEHYRFPGG